ncbi:MAG: hypothetical protein LUI08_04430 [Prevotella sp.]|nr:hypothetical protein [Prevotella sp.]
MKKFDLRLLTLLVGAVFFTGCSDDDGDTPVIDPVYEMTTTGAFVLNEGNYYSGIDGSLSYIDYAWSTITNNLFYAKNSRSLGGTPNSMVIDDLTGEIYIACTDENRVEITDSEVNSLAYVAVNQPREMVFYDGYVYVTSYDGKVSKISTSTHEITAVSDVVGACLEGIAVRDGVLYVCNAYNSDYTYNTNVVKMDAATLAKTGDVEVACNPTAIKLLGNDLYVLSTGNYYDVQAQIQRIDSSDNVSYVCDGTCFDVADGKIYVINSVTDWTTYETNISYTCYTTSGTSTAIVPPVEIASPCAIAVDSRTGKIFISSYVMGAYGYADYAADGYVVAFEENNPEEYTVYYAGVGPCNIVFRAEEEEVLAD